MSETKHDYEARLREIGVEGWRRAMSMPPMPPPTRRQRIARAVRRFRWQLAALIEP
jgi:hypothetical protein